MASGNVHDFVGGVSTVAIAVAVTPLLHPIDAAGGAAALGAIALNFDMPVFLGGLIGFGWLSPDVDIKKGAAHGRGSTNVIRRWGALAWIWMPFQAKHRGITHSPIIGSLLMQLYLVALLGLPLTTLCVFFPVLWPLISPLFGPWLIRFSGAIVAQQLVHLFLDKYVRN